MLLIEEKKFGVSYLFNEVKFVVSESFNFQRLIRIVALAKLEVQISSEESFAPTEKNNRTFRNIIL
jgi:hypothetical protein